jgi:DNA repair protein RadD
MGAGGMIELRYYQTEAVDALFDYFGTQAGSPVIAMPTGVGKSFVIAEFVRRVRLTAPHVRLMVLTRTSVLVTQDVKAILKLWPAAPVGIYAASLNKRDTSRPIIVGTAQSVTKAIEKGVSFGKIDILIVDEVHQVSDKEQSDYQKIIRHFVGINERLKCWGTTATAYRTAMGSLTEGSTFTDICYDCTDFASFNRFVAEEHLSPLIGKDGKVRIDTSTVKIVAGEFNQKELEAVSGDDRVLRSGVAEVIERGQDRLAWLAFATGIANSEKIAAMIRERGHLAEAVHSKLSAQINDERINKFLTGQIQCLVSGHKLTTGFDHPPIDLIADFNPTMSAVRHVQKLGRGTRPSLPTGKENCLYLDFSGNVGRLGPINDPVLPRAKGKSKQGDAPIKLCPKCGTHNHTSARVCDDCGYAFPIQTKLVREADPNAKPMRFEGPEIAVYNVSKIAPYLHEVKNDIGNLIKPPMLKLSHWCGLKKFDEYVFFQHDGFARKSAERWWKNNGGSPPVPKTSAEALARVSEIKTPSKIHVWMKKFPNITKKEFTE